MTPPPILVETQRSDPFFWQVVNLHVNTHRVLKRVAFTGYMAYLERLEIREPHKIRGRFRPGVIELLRKDKRFGYGPWWRLHRDVGTDLIDFRAHARELPYYGPDDDGSLQFVIDKVTFFFYADIDHYNPYTDVHGAVAHILGVIFPRWFNA